MKSKLKPEQFKIVGRGGTDAGAWIEYCNEQDFDAVIFLTDGYFCYDLPKPKYPVLWALTIHAYDKEEFKKRVKFGKVIKLESEEKK